MANCRRNLRLNGIHADIADGPAAAVAAVTSAQAAVASTVTRGSPPVLCALVPFEETPAALRPDVILAADVLYDPGKGPRVWLAPGRRVVGQRVQKQTAFRDFVQNHLLL